MVERSGQLAAHGRAAWRVTKLSDYQRDSGLPKRSKNGPIDSNCDSRSNRRSYEEAPEIVRIISSRDVRIHDGHLFMNYPAHKNHSTLESSLISIFPLMVLSRHDARF